jgi:hypothetical protein
MSFRGSASKDSDVMDMIRNNVVAIAEGVNGSPVSDMGVKGTGSTWPWWCWIFVGIAVLGLLMWSYGVFVHRGRTRWHIPISQRSPAGERRRKKQQVLMTRTWISHS